MDSKGLNYIANEVSVTDAPLENVSLIKAI
jgi:hypothetical protein